MYLYMGEAAGDENASPSQKEHLNTEDQPRLLLAYGSVVLRQLPQPSIGDRSRTLDESKEKCYTILKIYDNAYPLA